MTAFSILCPACGNPRADHPAGTLRGIPITLCEFTGELVFWPQIASQEVASQAIADNYSAKPTVPLRIVSLGKPDDSTPVTVRFNEGAA